MAKRNRGDTEKGDTEKGGIEVQHRGHDGESGLGSHNDGRANDESEYLSETLRGWWHARNVRWIRAITGRPVDGRSFDDGWTSIDSYRYFTASPHDRPLTAADVPRHIAEALACDAPRAERLRRLVDKTATRDQGTAYGLKAWYQAFCKRPCFHEDYLQAFNMPHVALVDTEGRGVERVTPAGVVAAGREYALDVLARHAAHVIATALRRAPEACWDRVALEPARDAEEAWTHEVVLWAPWMTDSSVCGPGYLNNESAQPSPEEQQRLVWSAPYAPGALAIDQLLERWREQGGLEGFMVSW